MNKVLIVYDTNTGKILSQGSRDGDKNWDDKADVLAGLKTQTGNNDMGAIVISYSKPAVDTGEWKVDLDTHKLVRYDDFVYEE